MIYAISDVHGYYLELTKWMEQLDKLGTICTGTDKLVFLGDYIDRGPDSFKTIEAIRNWQNVYGKENCVVLRGNHEELFLDFLDGVYDECPEDEGLNTSKTFLLQAQLETVEQLDIEGKQDKIYAYIRKCIKENHKGLISWIRKLPYYYQTENQIFVHGGVDEEIDDWWNTGTPEEVFTGKYPPTTGEFYKDIVAGHTAASTVAGNKDFQGIYYDGQSHYYIDGAVEKTGKLLCLAYDEKTNKYYEVKQEGIGLGKTSIMRDGIKSL